MTGIPPDTVLITGASGFIGNVVAQHMRTQGYRVRVASRTPRQFDLPPQETALLPGADASGRDWDQFVAGADHVVHCAGIADASARMGYAGYRAANVDLTVHLAQAALHNVPGRFVFMSSVRAVTGSASRDVITGETAPRPGDDYGRSKLEAETRLADIFAGEPRRLVTLRPVAVYGERMRGGLAGLLRLARLPFPLPVGGLPARRSLLDVERLAAAALHALAEPATGGGTYIVSDRHPLTLAEVVTAMRDGLGNDRGVFALPEPLLAALFAATGRGAMWKRLSGPLVASPATLAATGWTPAGDTQKRLTAYAARWRDTD